MDAYFIFSVTQANAAQEEVQTKITYKNITLQIVTMRGISSEKWADEEDGLHTLGCVGFWYVILQCSHSRLVWWKQREKELLKKEGK